MDSRQKSRLKAGLTAALPIVIGYIPIAMAFGLLAKATGISLLDSFLFSAVVFAGASQFMALNLLQAGVACSEIVLATLLMNFRHFLMSASLTPRLEKKKSKWLPLVAFGITDESFSVASTRGEKLTVPFLLALQFSAYFSWLGGTVLGYLLGAILPTAIKSSMGIALYAMFVAILLPEAKKSAKVSILAFTAGAAHFLLASLKLLPSGWNLILAIILAAGLGAVCFKEEEKEVTA